ncbi:hypothetical protein JTB14_026672 [Gonioctena quinquepunctata]|nr:hypothetical protein JTB14_026672 [Gonioctena quinquepunctata]
MKIIPDLYTGKWNFRSEMQVYNNQICGVHDISSLNQEQRNIQDKAIEEAFSSMGKNLGCTHLVEHVIHTTSLPIKQGYYPISPALQNIVNKELDDMLAKDIVEPSTSP